MKIYIHICIYTYSLHICTCWSEKSRLRLQAWNEAVQKSLLCLGRQRLQWLQWCGCGRLSENGGNGIRNTHSDNSNAGINDSDNSDLVSNTKNIRGIVFLKLDICEREGGRWRSTYAEVM